MNLEEKKRKEGGKLMKKSSKLPFDIKEEDAIKFELEHMTDKEKEMLETIKQKADNNSLRFSEEEFDFILRFPWHGHKIYMSVQSRINERFAEVNYDSDLLTKEDYMLKTEFLSSRCYSFAKKIKMITLAGIEQQKEIERLNQIIKSYMAKVPSGCIKM